MLLRKTRQGPPAPQAGTRQAPPAQTWSGPQPVPSAFGLHLPFLHVAQGPHGFLHFFLALRFLAAASGRLRAPRAPVSSSGSTWNSPRRLPAESVLVRWPKRFVSMVRAPGPSAAVLRASCPAARAPSSIEEKLTGVYSSGESPVRTAHRTSRSGRRLGCARRPSPGASRFCNRLLRLS